MQPCDAPSNVFPLSQPDVAGLNRLANSMMQNDRRSQRAMIEEIGSATAAPLFGRDIRVVERFREFLQTLGSNEAAVDFQVATGTGGSVSLATLGAEGEIAGTILNAFRKLAILGDLRDEPDARSISEELARYWSGHTQNYLEQIAAHGDSVQPLKVEGRISVCIPVADHEEGDNIYRTLELFLNQTISAEQFEVVLFLNHPEHNSPDKTVVTDHTRLEVERFQREHPEINIHFFQSTIPEKFATIGYVRKVLNDVTLHRYFRRGDFSRDHILVRMDADTWGLHPKFLENYVKQFEKHPNVDAFKGQLDWDWPTLMTDPVFLYGTRLYTAMARFAEIMSDDLRGGGANFAVKASRYAAVFGYKPFDKVAEDIRFGEQLISAREVTPDIQPIRSAGAPSRLWTSSRRAAVALNAGTAPALQWSEQRTLFDLCNPHIRKSAPPAAGKNFNQLLEADDFILRIEAITEQTVAAFAGWYGPNLSRQRFIEGVLESVFGLKVRESADGRLKVEDASHLREWISSFAEHAPQYWTQELGFRWA